MRVAEVPAITRHNHSPNYL